MYDLPIVGYRVVSMDHALLGIVARVGAGKFCIEAEGALPRGFDLDAQQAAADSSCHVRMTGARDRVDAGAHLRQSLREERLGPVAELARTHAQIAQDPGRLEPRIIRVQWWVLDPDGSRLRE